MHLTLEERERVAYIEGRTEEAALLAQAIDAENDALDEMRHERDGFKDEVRDLERGRDRLESELEASESKVLTLEAELDNAENEISALGREIREKCLDLV